GTASVLVPQGRRGGAERCRPVAVLYAGNVVEYTDVVTLFDAPLHPYTVALHNSIPRPGDLTQRLHVIPGQPPDLARMPSGCPFRTRCLHAMAQCAEAMPQMREVRPGHWVRCFLHYPL